MYFYTRNGIAPFLVLNLVILYSSITVKYANENQDGSMRGASNREAVH